MTSLPTDDALTLDVPLDPRLRHRLDAVGLSAVMAEATLTACERVNEHLGDPSATDSHAAYAAWLRRQVRAWTEVRLPAVAVAASQWPFTCVHPHCLDAVGLLVADLRELAPRMRPTIVPDHAVSREPVQPGVVVGVVAACARLAADPAYLLPSARALTAGKTRVGPATRYLTRCVDLAARAPEVAAEIDRWAATAGPVQSELAVNTARRITDRLADGLDAQARAGW